MLVGGGRVGGTSLPSSILEKSRNRPVMYFVHKKTKKKAKLAKTNCSTLEANLTLT